MTCPECGRRAVFTGKDNTVDECPNGHQWIPPGSRR